MTTTRARWHQSGKDNWILKMPYKYGSAVLATITEFAGWESPFRWWLAWGRGDGWAQSKYAAQRAARRAIREGEGDVRAE